MAAFWPLHIWPSVLEASYLAKTGVQKDFTLKLYLGEIMVGKAHKMIIQYFLDSTRLAKNYQYDFRQVSQLRQSVNLKLGKNVSRKGLKALMENASVFSVRLHHLLQNHPILQIILVQIASDLSPAELP